MMANERYIVLDSDSVVVQVTLHGGTAIPPDGGSLMPYQSGVEIGSTWNGSTFDPPPAPEPEPLSWDAYEFKLRLTTAERIGMRTAAATDPVVYDFLDVLDTAAATGTRVVSTDPVTTAGIAYMVEQGLLTQPRADEVLGF